MSGGAVFLSVVAPAFNEAAGLAGVVREWVEYLGRLDVTWEIVVCDDASTDATAAVLADLQTAVPGLRVVRHERNRGAAAAIATGIAASAGTWVLITDSDGQFDLASLDLVLDDLRSGRARAFTGVRESKQDSLFMRVGSWLSGRAANLACGSRYRDFNSIFKVVDGDLLRGLRLEAGSMNASTELTALVTECGLAWTEFPVGHRPRVAGARTWVPWKGAVQRAEYVGYLAVRARLIRDGALRPTSERHDVGSRSGAA